VELEASEERGDERELERHDPASRRRVTMSVASRAERVRQREEGYERRRRV
jgi:hypothetical protein